MPIKLPESNAQNSLQLKLIETLSPAELRVLKLAAAGKTEQETADVLNRSYKTIKFHKTRIFKKLKVKTIVQAVLLFSNGSDKAISETNIKEYVAEFSRLNHLVNFLKDSLEEERTRIINYKLQIERYKRGEKGDLGFLPSSTATAFGDRLNGVPK